MNAKEAMDNFLDALKIVREHSELGDKWLFDNLPRIGREWYSPEYYYIPDHRLMARIKDYKTWCKTKTGEDPGKLLEEIVLLAFLSLKGHNSITSYQSYAPQFDLVVSGDSFEWQLLMGYLRLEWPQRTIIAEAKNWDEKIDDKVFSRLCGILLTVFKKDAALGVYFTRKGATGFPTGKKGVRQRSIRLEDAQATQLLFHASSGKYVVVFDDNDIQELIKPGSLPRILALKMRAIEQWTGMPIEFNEQFTKVDLPGHLLKYMS